MNRGVEVSEGDYLAFVDNDIIFGHWWDRNIIKRLDEDLVAASPNSNTIANYDYPYGFFVPQNSWNDNDLKAFEEYSQNLLNIEDSDLGFAGEAIVMRRNIWEQVKWNEQISYGGNDWCLCLEIIKNALPAPRILYGSNIYHLGHNVSDKPHKAITEYKLYQHDEYKYLLPRNYFRDLVKIGVLNE